MKFLFDFFPLILFFAGYKFFGIYGATVIAMAASLFQVLFYRIKNKHYEKLHLISFLLIFILGGATLFFHNPWFIKWKPTGIYWVTALFFLGSTIISKKPLIQKMMENNVSLPPNIWHRLNLAWVLFFVIMGTANLFIAYSYSTDVWINFKLFGGAGLTLLFIFLQAFYLSHHVIEKDITQPTSRNSSNLS